MLKTFIGNTFFFFTPKPALFTAKRYSNNCQTKGTRLGIIQMSAEFINNIIYIFSKSAMLFEFNRKSMNVESTKKDQELNH